MNSTLTRLILIGIMACGTGCGSLVNLTDSPPDQGPTDYGGVEYSSMVLSDAIDGGNLAVPFTILMVADLPLCVIADTLALPFTTELDREDG